MPVNERILLVISIVGPIVVLASTLWGLSRELSNKEEGGRKRLTRAGQVAVALAVGSGIISTAAIGMRALVDQGKLSAQAEAEVQRDREKRRLAAEERRWQEAKAQQIQLNDKVLSQLQLDETRRQGTDIRANQGLLAAVQAERDLSLAAAGRLFQAAQSRSIVRQSQPLRALAIRMVLSGFTAAEMKELREQREWVEKAGERDDEYDNGGDATPVYYASSMFSAVMGRMLEWFGPGPRSGSARPNKDRLMILDLDGTGSWKLPIGFTDDVKTKGFVYNRDWLWARTRPHGGDTLAGREIAQDIGPCPIPAVTVDRDRPVVILEWAMPADCLAYAVHSTDGPAPSAHFSPAPRIAIFHDGEDGSAIKPANAAMSDVVDTSWCWTPRSRPRGARRIELQVTPNESRQMTSRHVLRYRGQYDIRTRGGYDYPLDYGDCAMIY